MTYEQQDIAVLAAELRRFSETVSGGPHERAADVLLELYDAITHRDRLLKDCQNLCMLRARENNRFRRILNLKNLPLLRNTVDADVDELIDLHNKARERASWAWTISPLDKDDKLMTYAQEHANWMADKKRLRHSAMRDIMKLGFKAVGENIAYGQETPESVFQAWMWSPGHRRNIMSTKFSKIGVGARKDTKGNLYWCVCFGHD